MTYPPLQLHVAACSLISDTISRDGDVSREALRQLENYLSVLEIARSGQPALEALPTDDLDANCGILHDLLLRVEDLVQLIPVDLKERLLCLVTCVTCFASTIDLAETQLLLLRIMDSCEHVNPEWAVDLLLLQFQGESCASRSWQL